MSVQNIQNKTSYFEEKGQYSYSFQNVKLKFCGKEFCSTNQSIISRIHEEYVIFIVLSGKYLFKENDKSMEVGKGNAILVRPGQSLKCENVEMEQGTFLWFGITGNSIENIVKQIGFSNNSVIKLSNTDEIDEKIMELLQCKSNSLSNELKRQSCFYSLLALLIEKSEFEVKEDRIEKAESLYVNQAVEIIMENCDKKIKVNDIAKQIGINRSYLTNLFKKEMGISPQNFIIEYRLERAAQLLKETNRSMVDVALEVGYNDSLAFSKAFKQKYGMSPSKYRKEQ